MLGDQPDHAVPVPVNFSLQRSGKVYQILKGRVQSVGDPLRELALQIWKELQVNQPCSEHLPNILLFLQAENIQASQCSEFLRQCVGLAFQRYQVLDMFSFRTVLKLRDGQKAFSGVLRQVITKVFNQSDDGGQVFNGGFIVFLADLADLCFLFPDIAGTEWTAAI